MFNQRNENKYLGRSADSNLSLLGGSGKQGFLITNHWKHPILSTLHLAGIPNLGGNFCYCSVNACREEMEGQAGVTLVKGTGTISAYYGATLTI